MMSTHSLVSLLVGSASFSQLAYGTVVGHIVARDGPTPGLPFDPNTTGFCTWWVDLTSATTCQTLIAENFITLDTFRRWNPSIPATCTTLQSGRSYCVEAAFEPVPTTTSTTPPPPPTTTTTTTPPPATTTQPSNGITTPLPTQPNLVTNCDAFYLVQPGDSCDAIASANRITLAQFLTWNPSAGATCSGLWANAYACVSIIGVDPPPPTTTTTSAGGNGITTPVPTQVGMVPNCNKFHFVASGQTCAVIASLYAISVAQFTQWNPAANADCSGLWASTYACVGVIGMTNPTPSPTTTTIPTGVATPTPTQPGMVNGCKKFAFVNPGDTCAAIAGRNGITVSQFVAWNTGVGGTGCTGLWANTYACVGI